MGGCIVGQGQRGVSECEDRTEDNAGINNVYGAHDICVQYLVTVCVVCVSIYYLLSKIPVLDRDGSTIDNRLSNIDYRQCLVLSLA